MEAGSGGALPRVAVVGTGLWGRNHVRNYAEIGALALVVADIPAGARVRAPAAETVASTPNAGINPGARK